MQNLDIVWADPYFIIAMKNDIWYDGTGLECRGKSIYDLARYERKSRGEIYSAEPLSVAAVREDPYRAVVAHYAASYGAFTICDVGAHLGITAMDTVGQATALGADVRAFAFDAGVAAELTWRNFENNGFASEITFERAAVGDLDGHGIMYTEEGESVGNRVILGGSSSYPVRFVKLDTYLKVNNAAGPATVKIDVQGAEPFVLNGMRELIEDHPVSIMMEFTPWALRQSGVDPVQLLSDFVATHHIFDIGFHRERMIEVVDIPALLHRVDSAQPWWTDLLLVPFSVRDEDTLLACLREAGENAVV